MLCIVLHCVLIHYVVCFIIAFTARKDHAGLLGGAVYVNAFTLISHQVDPALREFSLAAASLGDSLGIACADIAGILIQVARSPCHRKYSCSIEWVFCIVCRGGVHTSYQAAALNDRLSISVIALRCVHSSAMAIC